MGKTNSAAMNMDKEFLEWWEVNRLTFFEDDAMGIREIAAAAWKAGQAAPAWASGVGELVRAVGEFLNGRQKLREMNIDFLPSPVIDEMERAWKKVMEGDASNPSDVGK